MSPKLLEALSGYMLLGVLGPKRENNPARGKDKLLHHTLNSITGWLFGRGETSYAHMRYARQVLTIEHSPTNSDSSNKGAMEFEINFFESDAVGIHSHDNDPMVIIVRCDDLEINKVLINQGSSTDILY